MIHVYTGNGKGKSTAAFGLAVRALGAGKSIFIAQFVKDMKYGECFLQDYFPDRLKIEQWGASCMLNRVANDDDTLMARKGLERVVEILDSGAYDIIILDELTIALSFNFLTIDEVLLALKHRNQDAEVVITGRYAPQELIDVADLVTEMNEVKHYYNQGILSRVGIDC